jgi:hypothetical protein
MVVAAGEMLTTHKKPSPQAHAIAAALNDENAAATSPAMTLQAQTGEQRGALQLHIPIRLLRVQLYSREKGRV